MQTLAGFSDVDNFCDVVDALEEQGIEKHMDVSVVNEITILIIVCVCTIHRMYIPWIYM